MPTTPFVVPMARFWKVARSSCAAPLSFSLFRSHFLSLSLLHTLSRTSRTPYSLAGSRRTCFGTTKYCSNFLRGIACQNPECMYLHYVGDQADTFTKEDLLDSRGLFNSTVNPESFSIVEEFEG